MIDPEKTEHWDVLARQLGADVPPPPEQDRAFDGTGEDSPQPNRASASGQMELNLPDASSAATPAARRRPPARPTPPVAKNHWQTLADSLGIPVSAFPPSDKRPAGGRGATANVAAASEPLAEATSLHPTSPAAHEDAQRSGGSARAAHPPDPELGESFIDEILDVETIEREPERRVDSASPERAGSGGRRPRRRRGRRGRRRREAGTQQAGDDRADKQRDIRPVRHARPAPTTGEQGGDGGDRGDRGDGRDARDAFQTFQDAAVVPPKEGQRAPSSARFHADTESGEPEPMSDVAEDTDQDEPGHAKRGNRRFPTWTDAVGVIVASNLEARQRAGSAGGSRGRRRRSGGKRH
jgi:hypothetical protein